MIFLFIFISGCSVIPNKNNDNKENHDNNQITADAVTKIYRACKYMDGNFCDEKCCHTGLKCGNREIYQECDLESGSWKNESFADSKCGLNCDDYLKNPEPDLIERNESKESLNISNINNVYNCSQSWKCVDKFNLQFQLMNCSMISNVYCERGCFNNSCIPLCKAGDFICKEDAIRKCDDDGNYYSSFKNCEFGCKEGKCLDKEIITNSTTGINLTNQTEAINQTNPINETINQTQNTTLPIPDNDYIKDKCINVIKFNYTGGTKATDEYFTLKNGCIYSIDMTGWTAKDESNHVFAFSSFNFGISAEISVVTGTGINATTTLYWGRGSAVWNNDKDTLYLNDSKGASVLIYSYP